MRVLAIVIRDLRQYSRNVPALVLSLAAPLVLTAIMGFAFGGLGGGAPQLQATTLQVANLDQGEPGQAVSLGEQLVQMLQGPGFSELVQVTLAADEAAARAAVDGRESEAAVIIPPGFTSAVAAPGGSPAVVELYHDPALSLRPSIVAGALQGVLDSYCGRAVASQVAVERLVARGAPTDVLPQAASRVVQAYDQGAQQMQLLTFSTVTTSGRPQDEFRAILGRVNAGMLVFFVFYAGAVAAETILQEEEQRTLARLFATPTPRMTILAAKFLSAFVMTLAQALVLVLASALLFGIEWGDPLGVAVVALATVAGAVGLGLLVVSFARDTRQAGYVIGLTLSVLGLAGGLFTAGLAEVPRFMATTALFVPQSWATKGWNLLLEGEGIAALLGPVAASLACGALTFALGALRIRRRYAR
jgi:ABC-2 type transport system permease protein